MKTIHRLVLKSYLGPMVLTFFIVMFVLMMNIVWRYIDELVGKGLSAGIIIELMTYFMANMIPMGLPLSMLLAAIMTMGNLGENYELLAMKSAGMSQVQMGSMATLGGTLGRTMSPIAGAAIICAGLAKVNPIEVSKRNALPCLASAIVLMLLL